MPYEFVTFYKNVYNIQKDLEFEKYLHYIKILQKNTYHI